MAGIHGEGNILPQLQFDLSGVHLSYAHLSGADLSYADLSYADLNNAPVLNNATSACILAAIQTSKLPTSVYLALQLHFKPEQ